MILVLKNFQNLLDWGIPVKYTIYFIDCFNKDPQIILQRSGGSVVEM